MKGTRRLTALAGTVLLGGCQSIFGGHQLADIKIRGAQSLDAHAFAASQLALGRQSLGQRQYGQALIAFRNAQLEPDFAAAAHNGMGIAYSALGRPDLTERYFKLAVIEAPTDSRYQQNLAHFQDRSRLAESRGRPVETLSADAAAATNLVPAVASVRTLASGAAIRIELPPTRMVTSQAAFGSDRAPDTARTSARPAARIASSGAFIRIELPPARMERVSYSEVRIATAPLPLRKAPSRAQALAQADRYPIRIAIQKP